MIYDIRLSIRYDYTVPVAAGRHLLRLLPADLPGQSVSDARLTILPDASEHKDFKDFFGNLVTEVGLSGGHSSVVFEATARVDRAAPAPTPDRSPPLEGLGEAIAAVKSLGPDAPHHFLGASPRIRPWPAITSHALIATKGAATTRARVEALGRALHADMTFDARATTVDTPLLEAFHTRKGVCQDFAQVMIAGLRGLGIPAGYVSGFLRTVPPPGRPRLEGADAMHAWVRAWCGTGWVEYDPTNACFAGEDHVTVAIGRDYGDVAPVAGVLRIAGAQSSRQAVDMVPLGEGFAPATGLDKVTP